MRAGAIHRLVFSLLSIAALAASRLAAQQPTAAAAPPDTGLAAALSLLDGLRAGDPGKSFEYKADSFVIYGQGGDSILLQGSPARVTHREAQLEAAELVYRRREEVVEARAGRDSTGALTGVPVLKRGDETLRGERILYDLRRERGTILGGRIHRDKGYYAGQTIHTVSASEFFVRQGAYTTCDYAHPHFDFYSPRIKVVMDNMAIARPVYFRIKERRVFWIPFFIFSLRQNRQSGILTPSFGRRPISFGSDQSEWEVRNLGYYFAPSDYWDATLAGDLRQRSGWLAWISLAYARRYHWNGQLETQFENRQDGYQTQRAWRVELRHSQDLSPTAQLRASGTFQSNTSFNRDNSVDLQDRLNRTLRSNLSFTKRWQKSGNNLSLNASQTRNLDTQTADAVLPDLSFRKGRKPLWGKDTATGFQQAENRLSRPWYTQVYYDAGARLRNFRRTTRTDTLSRTSAGLDFKVSSQHKPFSWLQISPGLSETWSDEDLRRSSSPGLRTDQLNAAAVATQTFYGLFYPRLWRVTTIRHVFKPSLSASYQAARTDTGGVFGLNGEGGAWRQNRRLDVRLDNTFWAKIERQEEEAKVRLAQLNFATGYDFERRTRPLADLTTSLGVAAGQFLDTRFTASSEFYDDQDRLHLLAPRLRQFEVRTTFSHTVRDRSRTTDQDRSRTTDRESQIGSSFSSSFPAYRADNFGYENGLRDDIQNRDRRLQLSHYYSRTRSGTDALVRSWLRIAAGFGLGHVKYANYTRDRWYVNYSVNYNLRAPAEPLFSTDRITSELLSLQREFHDWTATFNLEPSNFYRNKAFYFKAQFRDIPQIKFERGDSQL
jgi:hypothetical protein